MTSSLKRQKSALEVIENYSEDQNDKKAEFYAKLFRTLVLYGSFLAFGVSRSLQGPTMLELQKQVNGDHNSFQIVFILTAITFPLGNVLGGVLFEKFSPSLMLFLSTFVLSFAISAAPFSTHISQLATATSIAEFALGLIDTGGNVYCLQLWKEDSGPYFNALHLAQGLGFMIAPVLAEMVLPFDKVHEMEEERLGKLTGINATDMLTDREEFELAVHDMTEMNPIQLKELEDAIHFEDYTVSPLQFLYLGVGLGVLLVSLLFLISVRADKKQGSYDIEQEKEEDNNTDKRGKLIATALIVIMTLYCTVSNGMSNTYGHFLTTFVVKGDFRKGAQAGARLTTFYYASQILIRAVNIFVITRVSSFYLLVSYLGMVAAGTLVTLTIPAFWGLQVGTVLIGFGAGSLFPMGLLWIQSRMELSGKALALFVVGTSVGAQILRIPEGAFIHTVPLVHLYLLTASLLVTIMLFCLAYVVVVWKDKRDAKELAGKEREAKLEAEFAQNELY